MNRKTATFIIVTFVAILIAALLYFYFVYLQKKPPEQGPTTTPGGVSFPPTGGGGGRSETEPEPGDGDLVFGTVPALRKISDEPVAGATIVRQGETDAVRYAERGKGHVYEAPLDTLAKKRLTNKTVPKVHEALWGSKGASVILRYLADDSDTVTTFYASITAPASEGAEGTLEGTFLSPGIREITVSPGGSQLFYLLWGQSGSTGIISGLDGSKKVQIFSSPRREWLISWPSPTSALVASRPGYDAPGDAYTLDVRSGALKRILSGIQGMTISLSPDAAYGIYSRTSGATAALYTLNVKTGSSSPLPLASIADKCTWVGKDAYCAIPEAMPDARYPDNWYQGLVSFSDEIWKIDAEEGYTEYIANLKDLGRTDIDVLRPTISEDGKYMVFINKNDLSLWELQIRE